MNRRNLVFLIVCVLGVLLDQGSKFWIVQNIPLYGEMPVIDGWFSLVHAQNPGAAFSILKDFQYRQELFLVFTLVAVFLVGDALRKLPQNEWFQTTCLALILSGAIGNAIDRVRQRVVTDFLHVYTDHESLAPTLKSMFGTAEYPAFNIADAALLVGIFALFGYYWISERKQKTAKAA